MTYELDERGKANYTSEGVTGASGGGKAEFADYMKGDERLSFERYGDDGGWEISVGRVISEHALDIYPSRGVMSDALADAEATERGLREQIADLVHARARADSEAARLARSRDARRRARGAVGDRRPLQRTRARRSPPRSRRCARACAPRKPSSNACGRPPAEPAAVLFEVRQPYVDVSAHDLSLTLGATIAPALETLTATLGGLEIELRLLGCSHQALVDGGAVLSETVACVPGVAGSLPQRRTDGGYDFRARVERHGPEAYAARAARRCSPAPRPTRTRWPACSPPRPAPTGRGCLPSRRSPRTRRCRRRARDRLDDVARLPADGRDRRHGVEPGAAAMSRHALIALLLAGAGGLGLFWTLSSHGSVRDHIAKTYTRAGSEPPPGGKGARRRWSTRRRVR